MPLPQISLAVVGARFANKRGPTRIFEIAVCKPGERVDLVPEPKNPADKLAIAVFSVRGVQLGYLSAERAPRIGQIIRQGTEVRATFQEQTQYGAIIRVAFDGEEPVLPPARSRDPEPEWWPDEQWPDE